MPDPALRRASRAGRWSRPPPNACDTHCHVFGPAARFPYAGDRSYTPPDAPLAKYLRLLDTLGFDRGALVQGSGARPRQFRDARCAGARARAAARRRGRGCRHAGRRAAPLAWLGVRGLRFNHFFRDGQLHYRGGVPLEAAQHACTGDEGARLAPAALDRREGPARHDPDPARSIGLPVVIDHMGRTDARPALGAGLPEPAAPARRGRLLGEALGRAPRQPGGAGLSGRARRSTRRWSPRTRSSCVWGSDWPHPRMEGEMPDAGHLLDLFNAVDAGRRDPPPHPRRQSGAAVRFLRA